MQLKQKKMNLGPLIKILPQKINNNICKKWKNNKKK